MFLPEIKLRLKKLNVNTVERHLQRVDPIRKRLKCRKHLSNVRFYFLFEFRLSAKKEERI